MKFLFRVLVGVLFRVSFFFWTTFFCGVSKERERERDARITQHSLIKVVVLTVCWRVCSHSRETFCSFSFSSLSLSFRESAPLFVAIIVSNHHVAEKREGVLLVEEGERERESEEIEMSSSSQSLSPRVVVVVVEWWWWEFRVLDGTLLFRVVVVGLVLTFFGADSSVSVIVIVIICSHRQHRSEDDEDDDDDVKNDDDDEERHAPLARAKMRRVHSGRTF